MSDEGITRRSLVPGRKRRELALQGPSEPEIRTAIETDPDAAPVLDDDWFRNARIVEGNKVAISLRVDPDVLAFYRGLGERYQTRMNAVLRAFMEHEQAKQRG